MLVLQSIASPQSCKSRQVALLLGGPCPGAIENARVRLTHVDNRIDLNPCAGRRLEVRGDLAAQPGHLPIGRP